jgi:PAP2 superfamily
MPVEEPRPLPERIHRVYWWKEALLAVAFYLVYSWTRNRFGSNAFEPGGIPYHAFHNAERVIRFERMVGLYHEETIQDLFLPYHVFIQFWNTWYGTAHFVVTLAVFVLLFWKRPAVFPVWRNSLAIMTALAIVGFALFPLMPPRLLDKPCDRYGGACIASDLRSENGSFGFVDTLSEYGGPWSFDSEKMADISNQFAAMPSMHIGWSTWCAVAVWPLLRRRWQRAVVFLYPLATLFCIIVTANHFWLDGAGGLLCFAVGTLAGWGLYRWNQNRLDRKHLAELGLEVPEDTREPVVRVPPT